MVKTIWRVESYREINEVYAYETITDVEYLLINVDNDDDWIDAFDEDCVLVARAEDAQRYLRGRKLRERAKWARERNKPTVDRLLDAYNDYMRLYRAFGDREYREQADKALEELRKMTGGDTA